MTKGINKSLNGWMNQWIFIVCSKLINTGINEWMSLLKKK